MKKPNKTWKKILRYILLIVCGAVFGINIYLANANSLVGNQMPMPFGCGAAVVLSGSMEPTYSVDDLIIVREAESYEVGDIIVYQSGGALIVHRIVLIEGEMITTKGDANNTSDQPIEASAVKGKVAICIPKIGILVDFLKSPIGTIMVLAAAIALMEIPRRREKKQDEEERQKIMDEIRRLKENE